MVDGVKERLNGKWAAGGGRGLMRGAFFVAMGVSGVSGDRDNKIVASGKKGGEKLQFRNESGVERGEILSQASTYIMIIQTPECLMRTAELERV